jgi:hypothetical protein
MPQLQHCTAAVDITHQTGQQVAFAVQQPVAYITTKRELLRFRLWLQQFMNTVVSGGSS